MLSRSRLGVGAVMLGGAIAFAPPGVAQDRLEVEAPSSALARQAERGSPELWRLALGPVFVDDMRLLGRARMLVGLREHETRLRNDAYVLVDLQSGQELWRLERRRDGDHTPLIVLRDLIVFWAGRGNRHELLAVDAATGNERWKASFKADDIQFVPAPRFDRILVERRDERDVELTALALGDGREQWKRSHEIDPERAPPPPSTWPDGVWTFYSGVARLDPASGDKQWERPDLQLDTRAAPPRLDADLLLLGQGERLLALDVGSGTTRWTRSLHGYRLITNVYPYDDVVYVRGMIDARTGDGLPGTGLFVLTAVDRTSGAERWSWRTLQPTVSNLIERDGRLYVATPQRVLCLDAATGKRIYEADVGAAERLYPVRLRVLDSTVAYIGELNIVSFDAETGRRAYRVGFTPIGQEASLAGLDVSIPQLQRQIAELMEGRPSGGGSSGAAMASAEAQRYQNLSNYYHDRAFTQRQMGDEFGASLSEIRSQTSSQASRTMTTLALGMSILELGLAIRRAREFQAEVNKVEGLLELQEYLRTSILGAYGMAESGDYVYRPVMRTGANGAWFTALAVVHLPTGRRRYTALSPRYQLYGLWNYLDVDKGLVYHHGIGLDPEQYTWSDKRNVWPHGKVRTVETSLIAVPVEVP